MPLDQIWFDIFIDLPVRLTDATDELILRLQDAIPPLNNPEYIRVDDVDYLDAPDLVLGYSSRDESYAYPFRILNFHEFVNDEIDGMPVLISYCPLCRSGIVFDRRVDGMTLTFGNTSALYQSDAVDYDKKTGSYWYQAGGEAIVGPLTGNRLKPLPFIITTWEEWKSLHPGGHVLSNNTGYSAQYETDYFAGLEEIRNRGRFSFPVSEAALDSRLSYGAHVLVVLADDGVKASPLDLLGDATVNDVVGEEEMVVFSKASGPSAAAYRSTLNGQSLTFQVREGAYVDEGTGSTWNLEGVAVSGTLKGQSLEPVPALFSFWFSAAVTYPGIDLYFP